MQIEKLSEKIERIIRELTGIFTPPNVVPVRVPVPRKDRPWRQGPSK